MFFWNSFAFPWSSGCWQFDLLLCLFLNLACTSGSSQFVYCWSLTWKDFEHYLANMRNECKCAVVWAFLALPFFGIGMKTDLFQSCGHCWVFQICWHIECSIITASSFRIWNSSAGIPSPPLALFVVMLPKALLISHSGMSGSRWLITLLWLSGSWRSFLYSSVYSCHLFLISYASIFVLYWAHLCMKKLKPTPVFLPGKSHGQRSLAGYSL